MSDFVYHFQEMPRSVFLAILAKRAERGQTSIIVNVGAVRSGKSYRSIRTGEEVSKLIGVKFDISNIMFEADLFLKGYEEEANPSGSTLLLDESGVEINSRAYQTTLNRCIGSVAQVQGYKGYICIFTAPDFSFIDVTVRKLVHFLVETEYLDYEKKICYTKIFYVETAQRTGKQYFKYIRFKVGNEELLCLKGAAFSMPSEKIIVEYEAKAKIYKDKVIKESREKIKEVDIKKRLTQRQKEVYEMYLEGISQTQIAKNLGVGEAVVSRCLAIVERKGYFNDEKKQDYS